jgi:aspartate aminotransferase-like enzyme
VTAPQKGWSGPAGVGVVAMNGKAATAAAAAPVSSFTVDLHKWRTVMGAYLDGGHAYHATMPTDAIRQFRDVVSETEAFGMDRAKDASARLGAGVRKALLDRGLTSVAAPGFEAPGVVVSYAPTGDATVAARFASAGLQIAAGVPLVVGEPETFATFRLGLFGLDKLANVDLAVANFEAGLDAVLDA